MILIENNKCSQDQSYDYDAIVLTFNSVINGSYFYAINYNIDQSMSLFKVSSGNSIELLDSIIIKSSTIVGNMRYMANDIGESIFACYNSYLTIDFVNISNNNMDYDIFHLCNSKFYNNEIIINPNSNNNGTFPHARNSHSIVRLETVSSIGGNFSSSCIEIENFSNVSITESTVTDGSIFGSSVVSMECFALTIRILTVQDSQSDGNLISCGVDSTVTSGTTTGAGTSLDITRANISGYVIIGQTSNMTVASFIFTDTNATDGDIIRVETSTNMNMSSLVARELFDRWTGSI